MTSTDFAHVDVLPLGPDHADYRLVTPDGVRPVPAAGRTFLEVDPEVLTLLAREAIRDISHLLRADFSADVSATSQPTLQIGFRR